MLYLGPGCPQTLAGEGPEPRGSPPPTRYPWLPPFLAVRC